MSRIYAFLAALGGILAGALALFTAGRKSKAKDNTLDDQQQELDAHDRITQADTGGGATDAERVRQLDDLAGKLGD